MKKKFFAIYALAGALVASPIFTSCVDDTESASVEALRGAKAEQLSALATLQKAQAEAARITAEAQKANDEAWAAYYNAQAAYQDAKTEDLLRQMEEAKAKFEYEIAWVKANYEKQIAEAKKYAMEAEQEILEAAEERLISLYVAYSEAASELSDLKVAKAQKEMYLMELEANALSLDEVILLEKKDLEKQIAEAEAEIKAWETYQGIDKADWDAELLAAKQAQYAAFAAKDSAKKALVEPQEAAEEVFAQYDLDELEEPSTVAAVAAIQKFQELMPTSSYWLGSFMTLDEAKDKYYEKVEDGDLPFVLGDVNNIYDGGYYWYDNGNIYYDYFLVKQFIVDGQVYNPFNLNGSIELADDVNVPLYKLNVNNEEITKISQGLVADKETYANDLGAAATETTEATGYYKNLADAEEDLAKAKEALVKAQEDLTAGKAEVEAAQAKVDEAKAAVDAEQEKIDAEQEKIDAANAVIATATANQGYAQTEKDTYTQLKATEEANKTTAEQNKILAEADKAAATTDEAKAAADAEIAAATAAIADATAKIEAYTAKIEAAEEAIEAANETIDAENAKIAAANKAIDDITVAYNEANRKLTQVTAMELTPAQQKVTDAESDITTEEANVKNEERAVARWKDTIETATEFLANADEILAAWEAVVAELSGDKFAAYEKEVKELAANETVAAYLTALEAHAEAEQAYTDAETLVSTLTIAVADSNVKDAVAEIASLKEKIAGLKVDLAELEATRYMFISSSTGSTWNESAAYIDRLIESTKNDIASLTDEIAIQEKIVELRKANLDAALAADEGEAAE